MRMENAISLEGDNKKWHGSVAAPNGSVYGILFSARRVAKLNALDKSIAEIEPDFGRLDYGRGSLKWFVEVP